MTVDAGEAAIKPPLARNRVAPRDLPYRVWARPASA
jgi:hypothetical protein